MEWKLKSFQALSVKELYAIMKLRMKVFILEQQCLYMDLDDVDQISLHHMACINDDLRCYSRISMSETSAKIQRVVIDKSSRGQGLGFKLMEKNLAYLKTLPLLIKIELHAQAHLQAFYQKLGFISQGEIFIEDDIPHIKMVKTKL